jgi:hypothetical protein
VECWTIDLALGFAEGASSCTSSRKEAVMSFLEKFEGGKLVKHPPTQEEFYNAVQFIEDDVLSGFYGAYGVRGEGLLGTPSYRP